MLINASLFFSAAMSQDSTPLQAASPTPQQAAPPPLRKRSPKRQTLSLVSVDAVAARIRAQILIKFTKYRNSGSDNITIISVMFVRKASIPPLMRTIALSKPDVVQYWKTANSVPMNGSPNLLVCAMMAFPLLWKNQDTFPKNSRDPKFSSTFLKQPSQIRC